MSYDTCAIEGCEDWTAPDSKYCYCHRDEAIEKSIERAEEILRSHGIKMSVASCGCCSSPWIRFEYNGEVIAETKGKHLDTEFDRKEADDGAE